MGRPWGEEVIYLDWSIRVWVGNGSAIGRVVGAARTGQQGRSTSGVGQHQLRPLRVGRGRWAAVAFHIRGRAASAKACARWTWHAHSRGVPRLGSGSISQSLRVGRGTWAAGGVPRPGPGSISQGLRASDVSRGHRARVAVQERVARGQSKGASAVAYLLLNYY